MPRVLQALGAPSPGTHKVRKVILLPVVSIGNCEDYQYKGVLGRPLEKENRDIKERNEEAKRIFYSWRQRGRRQAALGERPHRTTAASSTES